MGVSFFHVTSDRKLKPFLFALEMLRGLRARCPPQSSLFYPQVPLPLQEMIEVAGYLELPRSESVWEEDRRVFSLLTEWWNSQPICWDRAQVPEQT